MEIACQTHTFTQVRTAPNLKTDFMWISDISGLLPTVCQTLLGTSREKYIDWFSFLVDQEPV